MFIRYADAVGAVAAMAKVDEDAIKTIVSQIPMDWRVSPEVREAMIDFLLQRRSWLAANFVTSIFPQGELF